MLTTCIWEMASRMCCCCSALLLQAGFDVLGCYLSPVNDAYWKQSLAPGRHRVRMCQLAAEESGAWVARWVGG